MNDEQQQKQVSTETKAERKLNPGGFASTHLTIEPPTPASLTANLSTSSDTGTLGDGITALSRVSLSGQGQGGVAVKLTPFFTNRSVCDYQSATSADASQYATFFRGMLERGISRGEFRPVDKVNANLVIVAPVMMLMMWKHSFHSCRLEPISAPDYLDCFIDLLLNGLQATPASPTTH